MEMLKWGPEIGTCERGASGRTQVEAAGGKAVDRIEWVRGE